ncbi:MAG: sulfurtransferase TusA family protein [Cohaesibacteraceae bacterium]|nr:sulfurtransferase TusA family protein [Cohaesibacteraceae bacterium]MBL4875717.1 sulfurtransferase TusA family protein [Cohaesibacteraceae bacterium]
MKDPVDVDLRGLKCPLPVLKTRKALTRIARGEILRVYSNDPMAGIDIPHFCSESAHQLISQTQADDGTLIFEIKNGK